MISRVLLINPPIVVKQSWTGGVDSFPLGIAYIASVLKQNALDVRIIDCYIEGFSNRIKIDSQLMRIGMSDDDISEIIAEGRYDLVGISIQFSCQLYSAIHVHTLIKGINKKIITVAGGNHVSATPHSTSMKAFNYVIVGEGEYRLLNLIKAINSENIKAKIPHIISTSEIVPNRRPRPRHDFIEDLDSIPFPLYSSLPLRKYWRTHGNIRRINMIATRGCPYNCVFCSIKTIMGKSVRYRSVENVLEEIVFLKQEFDIEQVYFEDDNLTLKMKWAKELFNRIIKEGLGLEIYLRNGIRADKVDLELLTLMQRAGVQRVWFAPESGSQKTLDNIIKKKMKLEDCDKAIHMAKSVGLDVTCFLVIGFPEETIDDVKQTIKYGHKLRKLGCDSIWISCVVPYPGTELYDSCVKKGILPNGKVDYQSMSTMDSIIFNEHFSSHEIKEIRDRAMIELNRKNLRDILIIIKILTKLLFSNLPLFVKKTTIYFRQSII